MATITPTSPVQERIDYMVSNGRVQDAISSLFDELAKFQHVNELMPVPRELLRDLRGTLTGFMRGVD